MHAEEDKAARDAVETRNQLDNMVYQVEKQIEELGEENAAPI